MTSLFIIAAILTAGVTILTIRPLMSGAETPDADADTAQKDLALYRRQLAGLSDERDAGRLDDAAYESARVEIARRMLAADKRLESSAGPTETLQHNRPLGYALMALLPLGAMGLYLYLGNPVLPDQPLAARGLGDAAAERTALLSQKPMIESILENPDSVKSLMVMGLAAQEKGDYEAAARAFARALEQEPDKLMLNGMLGHALVQANDGTVTPEAMEQFRIVLDTQPDNALGLYYRALSQAQNGAVAAALEEWRRIIAQSPAEAPWNSLVQDAIDEWSANTDQTDKDQVEN